MFQSETPKSLHGVRHVHKFRLHTELYKYKTILFPNRISVLIQLI